MGALRAMTLKSFDLLRGNLDVYCATRESEPVSEVEVSKWLSSFWSSYLTEH